MFTILEKTILLKTVDLFQDIPGDLLSQISQISKAKNYENGEIISVHEKESSSSSNIGLIISVLLIQLIAIPGALLLSKLSDKRGNLFALRIVVFVWILFEEHLWLLCGFRFDDFLELVYV